MTDNVRWVAQLTTWAPVPCPHRQPAYSSYLGANLQQVNQGSDFKGFTTTLTNGLPPLSKGPFGPDTNTPAGYTYKQLPTGVSVSGRGNTSYYHY